MLRVMTCNLRTSLADDGPDHWTWRAAFCVDVVRAQAADLIGFQEVQRDQFEDLCVGLPAYRCHGMVDEVHTDSPVNVLFWRADRFELLSAGGFWLSETPHVTGSRSWGSACVRLANWVRLRPADGGPDLRFVNTHLDHVSQLAREGQARLIAQDAAAYPEDTPQLLTGDLNCDGANPALEVLRQGGWRDTHAEAHGDPGNPDTFHGFRGDACPGPGSGKIDWVFARGAVRAVASRIVRETRDGRYASDHDFVCADVHIAS